MTDTESAAARRARSRAVDKMNAEWGALLSDAARRAQQAAADPNPAAEVYVVQWTQDGHEYASQTGHLALGPWLTELTATGARVTSVTPLVDPATVGADRGEGGSST